jgi:hypothetical protein
MCIDARFVLKMLENQTFYLISKRRKQMIIINGLKRKKSNVHITFGCNAEKIDGCATSRDKESELEHAYKRLILVLNQPSNNDDERQEMRRKRTFFCPQGFKQNHHYIFA